MSICTKTTLDGHEQVKAGVINYSILWYHNNISLHKMLLMLCSTRRNCWGEKYKRRSSLCSISHCILIHKIREYPFLSWKKRFRRTIFHHPPHDLRSITSICVLQTPSPAEIMTSVSLSLLAWRMKITWDGAGSATFCAVCTNDISLLFPCALFGINYTYTVFAFPLPDRVPKLTLPIYAYKL